MADVLRLVLTNFWPFCAAILLIGAVGDGIASIVSAWRKTHDR